MIEVTIQDIMRNDIPDVERYRIYRVFDFNKVRTLYVGQTTNVVKRFFGHIGAVGNGIPSLLGSDILENSPDGNKRTVFLYTLEDVPYDDLLKSEMELIQISGAVYNKVRNTSRRSKKRRGWNHKFEYTTTFSVYDWSEDTFDDDLLAWAHGYESHRDMQMKQYGKTQADFDREDAEMFEIEELMDEIATRSEYWAETKDVYGWSEEAINKYRAGEQT